MFRARPDHPVANAAAGPDLRAKHQAKVSRHAHAGTRLGACPATGWPLQRAAGAVWTARRFARPRLKSGRTGRTPRAGRPVHMGRPFGHRAPRRAAHRVRASRLSNRPGYPFKPSPLSAAHPDGPSGTQSVGRTNQRISPPAACVSERTGERARKPGWAEIRPVDKLVRATLRLECDGDTTTLLCRWVTRQMGGPPNHLPGTLPSRWLDDPCTAHTDRIRAVSMLPPAPPMEPPV
jgi:hypothetical protein